MKVFCNGAWMSCGRENIITHKIDEYISAQSDIFVSDYNYGDYEMQKYLFDKDYKNVTIVFMRNSDEYDEWPRKNLGEWPYRMFLRRQYEYSLDPLIDCTMAEECDEGFFAWDGNDIDVFVSMLAFLGCGKKCSIYNTKSGDIKVINRIEDLQSYIMGDRNDKDKSGTKLFHGDVVDLEVLAGYKDTLGEMMDLILENSGEKLYKNDFKKTICKSKLSLNEKEKIVKLLSEKEDIFGELIGKVIEWNSTEDNIDKMRQVLMNTYEHSFRNANGDLSIAKSWIEGADGSDDDIVMYLWERYEDNRIIGKNKYLPVGMYADIEEALYYLETMTSNGGMIEVWERRREDDCIVYFDHLISFYSDDTELNGFQFMRKSHINDHDPFEPETYVSKNDHYMYVQ